MSSEWKNCRLGDVVNLKRGYDLPRQNRKEGNVPIVSSSGVSDFHSTPMVQAPGVVTGRYGTIGNVYYIDQDFFPLNTTLYVQDFKGNDPRFVSYFLKTIDFWSCSDKAAVPGVNRNHLHELSANIPPISEQKAVARILGAFDDKIELNRKTSETLEGIAKALFKSWFVNFEPVRAKAEGRPTGLPDEISELFPDSFEDSELGEIPSGWEISSIGELSNNFDSKRVPVSGNDRAKRRGDFPYYGATGIVDWIDDFLFDGTYLLIGEDGSVERGDGMAFSQYVSGKIWVNNHAHVLTGARGVTTEHLYLYFQFIQVAPYVTGAVQLKISQGRLNSIPVVGAPIALNAYFAELVQGLFEQRITIERENTSLASIRDSLLPKLISGELRVPDVEKMLEEVGI